jgi:hypothetical protein
MTKKKSPVVLSERVPRDKLARTVFSQFCMFFFFLQGRAEKMAHTSHELLLEWSTSCEIVQWARGSQAKNEVQGRSRGQKIKSSSVGVSVLVSSRESWEKNVL